MMPERESSAEIDRAAADWVARIDRGILNVADGRALDAWLAQDGRRVGALARATATLTLVGLNGQAAPGADAAPVGGAKGLTRRRVLLTGGSAVAASAIGVIALSGSSESYETALGEVRLIPLEDGSVVTLNTASHITVAFDASQRRIDLLRGEALFEVAKDSARPFIVSTGTGSVRAVGTAFTVRRTTRKAFQVLVQEGVVEMRSNRLPTPMRMLAGMKAEAGPGSSPAILSHVPVEDLDRKLAWRQGKIAFSGETLAQAAAEFDRYNALRIEISDARAAGMTVTGMFAATNPAGFADAVAVSLGLHASIGPDRILVSSGNDPAAAAPAT